MYVDYTCGGTFQCCPPLVDCVSHHRLQTGYSKSTALPTYRSGPLSLPTKLPVTVRGARISRFSTHPFRARSATTARTREWMPSNRTAQTGSSSNIARVPQRQLARRNLEARLFGLANAPDKFLPCASCLRDLSTLASVRDVPRRVLPRASASVSAEDVFSLGPARLRQAGFRDCSLSATTAESFPRPVSGVNTEPPRFLVYPNLF